MSYVWPRHVHRVSFQKVAVGQMAGRVDGQVDARMDGRVSRKRLELSGVRQGDRRGHGTSESCGSGLALRTAAPGHAA